jgi:hypothetical protein
VYFLSFFRIITQQWCNFVASWSLSLFLSHTHIFSLVLFYYPSLSLSHTHSHKFVIYIFFQYIHKKNIKHHESSSKTKIISLFCNIRITQSRTKSPCVQSLPLLIVDICPDLLSCGICAAMRCHHTHTQ